MSQSDADSDQKTIETDGHASAGENGLLDGSIRTFVLRSGRLTEAQRHAIDTLGTRYIIPFAEEPLDTTRLFPCRKPLVLEIGFGMGLATWQIARDRPQFNYIGIEVHSPGVGRLILDLEQHELNNVRIIQHDAIAVLKTMMPSESLAGIHIFYPDPWPKQRHHKRRLMQSSIVSLMAEKLASGAYLYFVTDIEEYASFAKRSLDSCPALTNRFAGYAPHQSWRPETKFENFAKNSGRGTFELFYIKL